MKEIIVFTDGSSRGNPGPGGYGAVIIYSDDGKVAEQGGHSAMTTNNRMEMTAAIDALVYLRDEEAEITIYTDSAYLLNGITKWIYGWEKNGWKTATKSDVENVDLWKELVDTSRRARGTIVWKKIDGHSGVAGNERADVIATDYADGKRVLLFKGARETYEKMQGKNFLNLLGQKKKSITNSAMAGNVILSKKKKDLPPYSYVSMIGGVAHADKTWGECEKRVKGTKGAKYKKVFSKEEEQTLIQEWTLNNLLG
jgi:ribonuclease HI